ncbi:MAG TPA: biopolymer transporter ExbD [Candidatus Bathyarchaeia archaeon]|nr:biopolymer transporter ExbD [Candidatus Bathyarchaeia archaeon]
MARKIRRRRSPSLMTDIPLTPLIDTALTLLVIFMITTPMLHNAIRVTLPQGKAHEQANAREDVTVYIDKNGSIFLNGVETTHDTLIAQLQAAVTHDAGKTVFVKADTAVSYGTVVELVDRIKVVGGIKYVALATKRT